MGRNAGSFLLLPGEDASEESFGDLTLRRNAGILLLRSGDAAPAYPFGDGGGGVAAWVAAVALSGPGRGAGAAASLVAADLPRDRHWDTAFLSADTDVVDGGGTRTFPCPPPPNFDRSALKLLLPVSIFGERAGANLRLPWRLSWTFPPPSPGEDWLLPLTTSSLLLPPSLSCRFVFFARKGYFLS